MSDMTVEYKRFPITVEMYYRMGENGILTEGTRVELLDGELIELAPISAEYQDSLLQTPGKLALANLLSPSLANGPIVVAISLAIGTCFALASAKVGALLTAPKVRSQLA